MKIAFDAKRITHNNTGLGNYGRYIINNLVKFYPEDELLLFSTGKGSDALRNRLFSSPSIQYYYPNSWWDKKLSFWWRTSTIVKDLMLNKPDLFHGLSNEIPFSLKRANIPTILTVHDLIFRRLPHSYKLPDRIIYNYKYKKSAILADQNIAVSERTKKDMIELWGIPESKIKVIYQGCDPLFEKILLPKDREHILLKHGISFPYILYVGSIEDRKNLLLLVKAVKDIKEDIRVVAIGRQTTYTQVVKNYIQENGIKDRVLFFHNIPFNELPAFYQGAQLFVYPSFYEGFGIPIVEALYSGIPVIGATGSCLEEAGGPDSLYINPEDPTELKAAILSVLHESHLAEHMISCGKEYVRRFDEQKMIHQLHAIYDRFS